MHLVGRTSEISSPVRLYDTDLPYSHPSVADHVDLSKLQCIEPVHSSSSVV